MPDNAVVISLPRSFVEHASTFDRALRPSAALSFLSTAPETLS
jgi:hypothetical protein